MWLGYKWQSQKLSENILNKVTAKHENMTMSAIESKECYHNINNEIVIVSIYIPMKNHILWILMTAETLK